MTFHLICSHFQSAAADIQYAKPEGELSLLAKHLTNCQFNISFPMIFPDSYQIITDSSRHL